MMLLLRDLPASPRRITRTSVSVDLTSMFPRCLLCMEGDERVGFFVLTLKVDRLSDHQIMLAVVLHHHAFSTM